MLVGAPAATAASPNDIYRDLADNGQLNGAYTKTEMQAFLKDTPVQGYGTAVVAPSTPKPPAGGVAGEATEPAPATIESTTTVESLPFTGAELGVLAVVGMALLLGGYVLRVSARTS